MTLSSASCLLSINLLVYCSFRHRRDCQNLPDQLIRQWSLFSQKERIEPKIDTKLTAIYFKKLTSSVPISIIILFSSSSNFLAMSAKSISLKMAPCNKALIQWTAHKPASKHHLEDMRVMWRLIEVVTLFLVVDIEVAVDFHDLV